MKNGLFALALVAGCALMRPAQAQVSKFNLAFGLGMVPLRATAPVQANPNNYSGIQPGYVLQTTNANFLLVTANLGFDAPLWQFRGGEQALGVSLNAALGVLKSSRQDVDGLNGGVLGNFPQYITYRYGAKASKHTKKDFGVGVGLGYRFCKFALPFSAPSAMLEGVYSTPDTDWSFRLSADLRPTRFYNNYSSEGLVEVLSIQEIQLQIGRSF